MVRTDLASWPLRHRFRVLAGRTGSGKTRLLQALAAAGAQVLDLEDLALHRGSILGGLPGQPQPSQKRFDTLLWEALSRLDPAQPVFVESESKKIGALQVPHALIAHMHDQGEVLRVEMPDTARVQLLLDEYGFFANDADRFCALLDGLVALRGHETVAHWQALARAGDWAGVFDLMMREHYDPLYLRSMDVHYAGYADAHQVPVPDAAPDTMRHAALSLMQRPMPAPMGVPD